MTDLTNNVATLPESPGVYIYKDHSKKVLYVGKAVNLKNRVKSYFQNIEALSPKTQAMITKIADIEHINVENEIEALLLEADLIKRYRPPYNIALKDDKFYKYIKIEKNKLSTPEGESKTISKIVTSRKKTKEGEYFGPYPESNSILVITKTLRKIFPYRDCSTQKFTRYQKAKRPCLYGHLGLCPAPCLGGEAIIQNNINIKKIQEYLSGKRSLMFKQLEREMKELSKNHEYEKAAVIRDQINSYNYLTQTKNNVNEYLKNPDLVHNKGADAVTKLLAELEKSFKLQFTNTDTETFRIETYDISNMSGKSAIGAMSVTTGGVPDKSEYRKFRIKTKDTPDDFFMLQEILKRRFNRIGESEWETPDLIVIDGGKGQLSSAIEAMEAKDIKIPMISLAKKEELIFFYDGTEFQYINLDINNPALKLIIIGRDEVHRFGIAYHRQLRMKNLYQ
ncbi:MAG: hypothetical protein QG570_322 [Patescibacteria group bacterium]|nr:hypothetical protein [Patescibacteria group bacterium]